MKKTVHIIVKGGMVQDVYVENTEVEVVIYDLDTDDDQEYDEMVEAIDKLRKSNAQHAY